MKSLTIASDASIRSEGNKSLAENGTGFAFYIRGYGIKVQKAWAERERLTTTRAELVALLGALKSLPDADFKETKLIYYMDCEPAITIASGQLKSPGAKAKWYNVSKLLEHYLGKFKEVEFRHVKAHTDSKGAHFYMNQWCDYNARSMMRYGRYYKDGDNEVGKARNRVR